MSDFLDSLLARNFNATNDNALPHVEPRLAARFETSDGAVFAADPVNTSAVQSPSTPRPSMTSRGRTSDVDRFLATQPAQPSQQTNTSARGEISPPEDPTYTSAYESVMPLTERERGIDELQSVESADRDALGQIMPVIEPAPMLIRVDSVIPAPDVQESDLRFPSRAEAFNNEPPASMVRVTIGRIEVVTPPAAAARPAAPRSLPAPVRPVRTLDDYLRRRNEGRR